MKKFFLKKFFLFLMLVVFVITPALYAYAHSGKTDFYGGHYDKSTGKYHYHHGYSAHEHTNGECPYDFNDATDHDSNYQSNSNNKSNKNKYRAKEVVGTVILAVCMLLVILGYIVKRFL